MVAGLRGKASDDAPEAVLVEGEALGRAHDEVRLEVPSPVTRLH